MSVFRAFVLPSTQSEPSRISSPPERPSVHSTSHSGGNKKISFPKDVLVTGKKKRKKICLYLFSIEYLRPACDSQSLGQMAH